MQKRTVTPLTLDGDRKDKKKRKKKNSKTHRHLVLR